MMKGHLFGASALFIITTIAAGCGVDVDADGNIVTGRVWFDQTGEAHCPYCDPDVRAVVTKEEEEQSKGRVAPHQNVCQQGHPVIWSAEEIPCPICEGAVRCPTCLGAGVDPQTHEKCPECLVVEEERGTKSTGICQNCEGRGTMRMGWIGPDAAGKKSQKGGGL